MPVRLHLLKAALQEEADDNEQKRRRGLNENPEPIEADGNKENEEVSDEKVGDQTVINEEVGDQTVTNEKVGDQKVTNEKVGDEEDEGILSENNLIFLILYNMKYSFVTIEIFYNLNIILPTISIFYF